MNATYLPLEGLRVVDWTEGVAGPTGAQMLGDLGASVIKVERPQGDWSREMGSGSARGGAEFVSGNRNKRDLCLDLRLPQSAAIADRLLASADVLLTAYRPGVMERLGLGYDAIHPRFPELIYARVSAYGYSGPLALRPGSDTVLQAASGLMSQIGDPQGDPQRVGIPIIDMAVARDLVVAVLAALLGRRNGQPPPGPIDVTLFGTSASLQAQVWQKYFDSGFVQQRSGNRNPGIAPAGLYRTKDSRYITIAVLRDEHWGNFIKAVGLPSLGEDLRFRSNADRLANRDELESILVPLLASRDFDEWVTVLEESDVLAAPVAEISDIGADPLLAGAVPSVNLSPGRLRGAGRAIALPVSFGAGQASAGAGLPPPTRGQHTREVLADLGYSTDEINDLIELGVVAESD